MENSSTLSFEDQFEGLAKTIIENAKKSLSEPIKHQIQPRGSLLEDLKPTLKYFATKKAELAKFAPPSDPNLPAEQNADHPKVDLLILGTDGSGKTNIVRALAGNSKLSASASAKTNEIMDIAMDQYLIKIRETSFEYINSWNTYKADAKILAVCI